MDEKEVYFNNCLRSTRNQIECAFGRLKARWRILNRNVDVHLNFAIELVYTCFILHNFCEEHKIAMVNDVVQEQMQIENRQQNCGHHQNIYHSLSYNSQQGKAVRDTLKEYLYDKRYEH